MSPRDDCSTSLVTEDLNSGGVVTDRAQEKKLCQYKHFTLKNPAQILHSSNSTVFISKYRNNIKEVTLLCCNGLKLLCESQGHATEKMTPQF